MQTSTLRDWFISTHDTGEKAMATHSSTLAWKIPWTEAPGGLQSMGSLRVEHDWATSLSLFTFMHWRRKWQPTPVFLPGESQRRGSLVDCHLWVRVRVRVAQSRTWLTQLSRSSMILEKVEQSTHVRSSPFPIPYIFRNTRLSKIPSLSVNDFKCILGKDC